MFARSSRAAGTGFVLGLLALSPLQLPTQRQPVFRSGANLVYVDVYPRRDGRVIEGLALSDFQVLEDGKAQTVELFDFIKTDPVTVDADRRDPPVSVGQSRFGVESSGRMFVLYLNRYFLTMEGARRARVPLRDFLERVIGPTELLGVLTPDLPARNLVFGRRLEVINAGLERYWEQITDRSPYAVMSTTPVPLSPREHWLTECYINRTPNPDLNNLIVNGLLIRHRADLLLESLDHLVVRLSALSDQRVHVLLLSGAWALPGPASVDHAWRDVRRSACDVEYTRLQTMDAADRFRHAIESAKRSNVSFIPIDPYGLGAVDPFASQPLGSGSLNLLRTLAENTGGLTSVGTNDLSAALRRIADGVSAYYLLGYYSTNTRFDGRYRSIDVKVAQPRVQVSARRGYLAPTGAAVRATESTVLAGSAAAPSEDSRRLGEALAALDRVRPAAEAFAYGAEQGDSLVVVGELPGRGLERWPPGTTMRVRTAGPDGVSVGQGEEVLAAGARGALVRLPRPASGTGPWKVRVTFTAVGQTVDADVVIPTAASQLVSDPVVFRATPSLRSPLLPVADVQFRRTERAHVEWQLYQPVDRSEVRLLDRRGQPLPMSLIPTESEVSGRRLLIVDLNVASLAAGDYVLEVTVGKGSLTERRYIAIRVIA